MAASEHGRIDPLTVARELLPLYQEQLDPDDLTERFTEILSGIAGGPVRLQLPEPLGGRPYAPSTGGRFWELVFEYEGALGRVMIPGQRPAPEIETALELELQRLAAHLASVQSLGNRYERVDYRLRALSQIIKTLAVARESTESEAHIVNFVGELYATWWAALYRPGEPDVLDARRVRSLGSGRKILPRVRSSELERFIPVGPESRAIPVGETGPRPSWLPVEARVLAPLDIGGERLGCLMLGERMKGEPYREEDLDLLATVAYSAAIALWNADLVEQLRERAVVDELTGLHNRRLFDSRLTQEFDRAKRYRRPLSLVLLDLDHFKEYNDTFGHAAGDTLLARVAAIIRAGTRKVDVTCRYGGEEFAVIAPETPRKNAVLVAERLRTAISAIRPESGLRRPVTVSAGVAAFPDDAVDPAQLVEAADQALYRAKADGRDRVVCA